jgi:ribosomal protein S25
LFHITASPFFDSLFRVQAVFRQQHKTNRGGGDKKKGQEKTKRRHIGRSKNDVVQKEMPVKEEIKKEIKKEVKGEITVVFSKTTEILLKRE